jgi:hypothetical protein
VAVVIGLTLALTGCGIFADRAESDVPTATEAEIVQKVNGMADRTAAAIGDAQVINPASNASPCDNNVGDESDAVQFVQGTYNIVLPRAVQQADFQRARDYWKGQGWTINEDWYKQDVHEGSVSAKEVNDGGSLTLVSTDSPTGLAVIAHSGCYRNQNQQQAGR